LNQVLLRLENLITKLDDNGLLSMTELLAVVKKAWRIIEGSTRNVLSRVLPSAYNPQPTTVSHGQDLCGTGREECDCGCSAYNEAYYGDDEID